MASSSAPASGGEIREVRFVEALEERYLTYALSTIMARSLPDVRDGLKPVHRRLLHAMRLLKLDPNQGFKKSARVVGDVMGKFHPHGDQSIYDALVRLAQDFSLRYPLIDGQGNFGNIDGDNAAAMRYTEARLTEVATLLLEGIDENAVDFRETYDGESDEPAVLPAAFPNLLANGAQGIAVGMATSIPPHNAAELCTALLHLIKFPNARIEKLVEMVPGPDFPTGGILCESRETVIEAYRTGRGAFRVRARWEIEKVKGGSYQIIVTEIPYQVQKSRLVEKIAELLANRKLAMLADVRDESAADLRLVLEPKSRNVDPTVLMESLFRQSELESRFSLNLNVLDAERTPRVMSLGEALSAFLAHRQVVLRRRSQYRLDKIEARLEVLAGFLIAYLNLDEVIRIIRFEDEPKKKLMKRFKLSDVQAEAILNMRLRALRKLEEEGIKTEHAELSAERKDLKRLLKDDGRQWKVIAEEIRDIRKRFGPDTPLGKRRTELADAPDDVVIPLEAVVEREPVTILCSAKGWLRRHQGPCGGPLGRQVQGGRPSPFRAPRDDHRPATDLRDQRPLLHHRGRQAARRPGLRRAGAPDVRPAQRPGSGAPPGARARPQAADRLVGRPRFRGARGRGHGADQEWQAGAQPGRRRRGGGLRAGRGRPRGGARREPQAADLPARASCPR